MSVFERYLTVWVFACIVLGTLLGHGLPSVFQSIGRMEVARVNRKRSANYVFPQSV